MTCVRLSQSPNKPAFLGMKQRLDVGVIFVWKITNAQWQPHSASGGHRKAAVALEAWKGRSIMQFDWIAVLIWRLHEPARLACGGGAAEVDAGDIYRLAGYQRAGAGDRGHRHRRAPEGDPFLD